MYKKDLINKNKNKNMAKFSSRVCLKANFQSARFSERAEFLTIKSCSAVTIHSISERHFLSQTKEFPPARKILLTGNWALD